MGLASSFPLSVSLIGWLGLTTGSLAQVAEDRGPSGSASESLETNTARGLPGNEPDARRDLRQSLVVESRDIVGESGQRIPLGVSIRRRSDVTIESIKLLGLPAGYGLKDPLHSLKSDETGENLDVTDWNIADLWIEQPDPRREQFWLSLILVWKWKSGESIEVSVTDFSVEISPKRKSPSVSSVRAPGSPNRDEVPGKSPQTAVPGDAPRAERRQDESRQPVEVRTQAPPPAQGPPPSARPTETRSSVARAQDLIARGDISGARLLLERGRARNEPGATFLLAQTWDPKMLRQWNVRGLRPDTERARALYDEAKKPETLEERQLSVTRR